MCRLKLTGTYLDDLYKEWLRINNWDEKDLFVYCGPFDGGSRELIYVHHKNQKTELLVHKYMFEPIFPSTNLEDYL